MALDDGDGPELFEAAECFGCAFELGDDLLEPSAADAADVRDELFLTLRQFRRFAFCDFDGLDVEPYLFAASAGSDGRGEEGLDAALDWGEIILRHPARKAHQHGQHDGRVAVDGLDGLQRGLLQFGNHVEQKVGRSLNWCFGRIIGGQEIAFLDKLRDIAKHGAPSEMDADARPDRAGHRQFWRHRVVEKAAAGRAVNCDFGDHVGKGEWEMGNGEWGMNARRGGTRSTRKSREERRKSQKPL